MNNLNSEESNPEEFLMLQEAAQEAGITLLEEPIVERIQIANKSGRYISAIKWGTEPPELVFLHGGAQNAHTWDSVALAIQSIHSMNSVHGMTSPSLLAIDLPGHGHSEWRDDHSYPPRNLAEDISGVIEEIAPNAKGVVGMSLGGLTSIMLAEVSPHLLRSLLLVDITPSVNQAKAEPILEFISGPEVFDSFEAILDYTQKFNPSRSEASLTRGIKNNAKEIEDGKWTWRWDPTRKSESAEAGSESAEEASAESKESAFNVDQLWGALDSISVPLILFKGAKDSSVLDDSDVEEFLRHKEDAEVIVVPDAGHSIQGDQPVELASLIVDFVYS